MAWIEKRILRLADGLVVGVGIVGITGAGKMALDASRRRAWDVFLALFTALATALFMRWFGTSGNQADTPPFNDPRRNVLDTLSEENHIEEHTDAGIDMELDISPPPLKPDA